MEDICGLGLGLGLELRGWSSLWKREKKSSFFTTNTGKTGSTSTFQRFSRKDINNGVISYKAVFPVKNTTTVQSLFSLETGRGKKLSPSCEEARSSLSRRTCRGNKDVSLQAANQCAPHRKAQLLVNLRSIEPKTKKQKS